MASTITGVRPASVAHAVAALGISGVTLRADGTVWVPRSGGAGVEIACDPYRDDVIRTSSWNGRAWTPQVAHYVSSPEDAAASAIL